MAVVMIDAVMLYRMRRLKEELAAKKKTNRRWIYLAAVFLIAWLLIGR